MLPQRRQKFFNCTKNHSKKSSKPQISPSFTTNKQTKHQPIKVKLKFAGTTRRPLRRWRDRFKSAGTWNWRISFSPAAFKQSSRGAFGSFRVCGRGAPLLLQSFYTRRGRKEKRRIYTLMLHFFLVGAFEGRTINLLVNYISICFVGNTMYTVWVSLRKYSFRKYLCQSGP